VVGLVRFALAFQFLASPSFALVGGYPVYPGQFPSVFIFTGEKEVLTESFCTGAKVGNDWILTAAHCLLEQTPSTSALTFGPWKRLPHISPGNVLQFSVARVGIDKAEHLPIFEIRYPASVERCLANPLQDPKCQGRTPYPDVAMVRVVPQGSFLKLKSAVVNLGHVRSGTYIDVVGYGAEGEGAVFERPPRLTYHGAVVSTDGFIAQAMKGTDSDRDGLPSTFHFFGVINNPAIAGHTNLGSGDSGGPVFLWGTNHVVGINSDGFCATQNPECQVTNNSFFSRLNFIPRSWWPF